MATIKKNKETSVGEDVEKLELLHSAGKNVKWCSHWGKQFGGSSKKLNTIPIYLASISTSCYIPQKNWKQGLKQNLTTKVHSNSIHDNQKVKTTQMSIHR